MIRLFTANCLVSPGRHGEAIAKDPLRTEEVLAAELTAFRRGEYKRANRAVTFEGTTDDTL